MCLVDKHGFPRSKSKSIKRVNGFQTGDCVRLIQPKGKYKGTYEGVVFIRKTGMFDLKSGLVRITALHHHFTQLSMFDGYIYSHEKIKKQSKLVG